MGDVNVTILAETTPVSQAGFGMPLVFDPANDVSYAEVEETSGVPVAASTIASDMISTMFSQSPRPQKVAIAGVDIAVSGNTVAQELDELAIEQDDYYFVVIASRVEAEQQSGAEWAAANGKLGVLQPDIEASVSDITALAGNLNSERNVIYAHDGGIASEDPYADAAIVGRIAPVSPGGTTWKFKSLAGVPVATYSNADVSTLESANVNTIVKKGGIIQTSEGLETSGGFADITRGKDWLAARIKEEVQFLLYNSEKVPYDDGGIAQVVAAVKNVLKTAVGNGLIAKDQDGNGIYTVTFPKRSDILTNTKANRVLPDIDFTATIAGAIHQVDITGVLQV